MLILAGSDSGGGAGLQADVKTVTALGGHAATAVTAITVKNSLGVSYAEALAPNLVEARARAVRGARGGGGDTPQDGRRHRK